MKFHWHAKKAELNVAKHGVTFEEAQTVFDDQLQLHRLDEIHSFDEQRYTCVGMSLDGRVLLVVYTQPEPDNFRLISARLATRNERNIYEQQDYDY